MATRPGITAPIYRIDVDAAMEVLGVGIDIVDLPNSLILLYNREKGAEIYRLEGSAEIANCRLELYRNANSRPNTSKWVHFFKGSGIKLTEIRNEMQHLVCFVATENELYAYTAGQAAVSFERFVDISFPIEVGRRIAQPEVKGVRSSQITGSTLASNVHFRDPRRLTHVESLDNVWTALSGELRRDVLGDESLVSVFGPKAKIRLDVTSAIKLGPRIETPEKIVRLINWLATKVETELPEDDGWSGLDAIKVLNPRKKKDLVARLKLALAEKVFVANDYTNIAVAHIDASAYDNATHYVAKQGSEAIYEDDVRPELSDIVDRMEINPHDLLAGFTAVVISTENTDHADGYGTSGSLLSHLHGEIRYNEKTHYLLAGKWYEVDAVYIEEVTKDFIETVARLDLDPKVIGMQEWKTADDEETYNGKSIATGRAFINGDRVLTDNVELFDVLTSDGAETYIIHVKRGFDVKIRDVRSQIVNSAQIIENDLRTGKRLKLQAHYTKLLRHGRTKLTRDEFLELFERPRVYVLAYGSSVKVDGSTLKNFQSSVARMEMVSLNSQFRQLSSADSMAKLRITWIEIVG